MGAYADEFPLLEPVGLYVVETAGNGNCLFNALSDQIYGNQSSHHEIRTRVIEYMREHADLFKQFIDVHPGGGLRRNPKRKNAGGYSNAGNDLTPPSQADIDRVFETHLQQMARGGTYGDNMEIQAFCNAFGYNVKIYQRDIAYIINGSGEGLDKPIAYIAYHTWEHYSSIRNIGGPHTGLPSIKESAVSPTASKAAQAKLATNSQIEPWKIPLCLNSLSFPVDHATVHKTLLACKGDVNTAVERLIEANEERRSNSGNSQGSSSVERDVDSDDEVDFSGPKKKQDRRLSRATRAMRSKAAAYEANKEKPLNLTVRTTSKSDTHEPPTLAIADFPKRTSSARRATRRIVEDSDDDWKEDDESSVGNSPASTSLTSKSPTPETKLPTPPTSAPLTGGVKLRLSQPKAPPSTRYQGTARPTSTARTKVSARDRRDLKKAAQKAAAKDRKKAISGVVAVTGKGVKKEHSPGMEVGIKTLYI